MIRRLHRDRRGATAVEFALLAPIFLGMMFFIIEGARMIWTKQTLREVAFSTVRCMSVSSTCSSSTQIKTYAADRAASYGITILAANIVDQSNVTCDSNSAQNKVTVTVPFSSPTSGLVGAFPTTLSAYACYPKLS